MTSIVVTRPKIREIHAPAFRDRVVHHLVVPPLEVRYEGRFYEHSYANRPGKGIHTAVAYAHARSALDQTFTGYKGGEFTMHEYVDALVGHYGSCGENITDTHFKYWESQPHE